MSPHRLLAVFAALNGACAVALGAFAAHGAAPAVKTLLTTGAQYQMVHALVGLVCALRPLNRTSLAAGWLAVSGGLIFSLALSAIGLGDMRAMGMVAPLGGLLMILGWLLLSFAVIRERGADAASHR